MGFEVGLLIERINEAFEDDLLSVPRHSFQVNQA